MKLIKNILPILLLCAVGSLSPRTVGGSTKKPAPQPKPTQTRVTTPPPVTPQQRPIMQAPSYAQALNIIKTQMSSGRVVSNNSFTQEFIDFVKSFNLSDIETKALLQAGANIHTTWTDNNETNKQILSSLRNNIQSIIPSQQTIPIIQPNIQPPATPTQPTQQRRQPTPMQQKQQSKTRKQTQQTTPVKPIIPAQPIPVIPMELPLPNAGQFKTNNLMILLDPRKSESIQTNGGTLTEVAITALAQKVSPLIMTSNILENIINARNFDSRNFNCYFHKSAKLVLVIPKQYISANLANATNFNLNEQARACGFNPAVTTAVTNATTDNLITQLQLQESIPTNAKMFIQDLTSLFIPQKKDGELISPEQDTKWIIYLLGHGHAAHQSIGVVREQYAMLKKHLTNPKTFYIIDPKTQSKVPTSKVASDAKEYEQILQGRSAWPNTQLVPESAQVAGIKMEKFLQLMKFFNNNLDIGFLHYITCFSGGSNQSFVNEVLSSFNVNFIVSTQGIHEGVTSSYLSGISFTEFFRLARLYINEPKTFVRDEKREKTRDPIVSILRPINPQTTAQNQPFVRFPHAESFTPIVSSKNTQILTRAMVKAHEIEKKPIDIRNTNLGILVVNAPRINVPINLGKIPVKLGREDGTDHFAIVSPSPAKVDPSYEALHVFKEINFEGSLQSFLFYCIHRNAKFYKQTFVVDTLTGISYQQSSLPVSQSAIKNLIIHIKGVAGMNNAGRNQPPMQSALVTAQDLRYNTIGANVYVTFELNGNIYQSTFAIKNFDNPDDLYRNIEKLTFASQPTQSTDMNSLANKFLTPQEVAQIAKPITLGSIAEYIDSKIDKQDPSMAMQSDADDGGLLEFVEEHVKKQPPRSQFKQPVRKQTEQPTRQQSMQPASRRTRQ